MRAQFTCLVLILSATACTTAARRPYQVVALTRGLEHDGFLVGVESRDREEVNAPPYGYDTNRFRVPPTCPPDAESETRRKIFERVMGDSTVLFVSHCFEMRPLRPGTTLTSAIYNAYDPGTNESGPDGVFDDTCLDLTAGYAALAALRTRLARVVEETDATHVILMCMGWNNDQIECLERYNVMLREMKAAAARDVCHEFRPVVIGLTWPSVWFSNASVPVLRAIGHYSSYFSKCDDADEFGFGVANELLHNVILPVKGDPDGCHPKVVLIGHSFGARALSRALFSEPYLRTRVPAGVHQQADLFLGLQPAMDARRFVSGEGREGSPYARFKGMKTAIVLTTSDEDFANPAARWVTGARHVGGVYGKRIADEHPDVFSRVHWLKCGHPSPDSATNTHGKVVIVDATSIVRGSAPGVHGKNLTPHNDILDAEMAALIWYYIRQIPPS